MGSSALRTGRWGPRSRRGRSGGLLALFGVVVLLAASAPGPHGQGAAGSIASPPNAPAGTIVGELPLSLLRSAPATPVPEATADLPALNSVDTGTPFSGVLSVLITLRFTNTTGLASLLAGSPSSARGAGPSVLTPQQFTARFSPDVGAYDSLVSYLDSFARANVTTFPDRLSALVRGPAVVLGPIFDTTIDRFDLGGRAYAAPVGVAELPAPLAPLISSVEGLGTGPASIAHTTVATQTMGHRGVQPSLQESRFDVGPQSGGLPLAPVTIGAVQEIYPTDLQVAYDEESLFVGYGVPSTENIASIVWDGSYTGTTVATACGIISPGAVGPFDPGDFAAFFNQTSPASQLHPTLVGVTLNGSAPSCAASWDTTGVVESNTAELEAIGATAPGATVWGVSVSSGTLVNLDTAFAAILSPPGTLPAAVQAGLGNVTVVDAGWALQDQSDAAWLADLTMAQARGISVVAPTGDAGDENLSAVWNGSEVAFPSTAATSSTGSLAVGGTTLTLNAATLHISKEVAWYEPAPSNQSATRGSSGGVSTVFPEPPWQSGSLAGHAIGGTGRGVPDVAAMANNTLITVSIDGEMENASNATYGGTFVTLNGTGLAAGVVAGLIATMDHVLVSSRGTNLGFLDPLLYRFASDEFAPLPNGSVIGHVQGTSPYTSSLPTLPFRDVVSGQNAVYPASVGYDLVTGWGSLDAYNYTMYLMPAPSTPVWGRLQGVEDAVNLSSLEVFSTYPTGTPASSTSASVQQNLFVANAFGVPIYWVQSVTTLLYSMSSHTWTTDYQGWVVFPFWGLYPHLAIYEFDVPPAVSTTVPLSLTIETLLLPGSVTSPAELEFAFGGPSSPALSFALPGASYILGAADHSYNWQGTTYTNGPNGSGAGGASGFLAPQISVVGFPGGATANFELGTSGNIQAFVDPMDGGGFLRAGTGLVTLLNTQTGELASNLTFTRTGSNAFTFGYAAGAGKATQGVYQFEVPRSLVRFTQTGAQARSTWYVNLTGFETVHDSGAATIATLQLELPNGTYHWAAAISVRGWSAVPPRGNFTVAGAEINISVEFGASAGAVTFQVVGPPVGAPPPFSWTMNITGGPVVTGATSQLSASLLYGTYSYHVSETNGSWKPAVASGTFVVSLPAEQINIRFNAVTFFCELVFQLPGGISPHMDVRIGIHDASGYFETFGARIQNGTVVWSVSNLSSGDTASPTHGVFAVHGPGPSASKGKYVAVVTITAPPNNGLLGLGDWGYAVVVGIPLLAVVLVVMLLRRRRKRRGEDGLGGTEESPAEPSVFDDQP